MKRGRKGQAGSPGAGRGKRLESGVSAQKPVGERRWIYRVVAVTAVPVALLLLVELGLRATGLGYSTSFLVLVREGARDLWVQNDRFGWRFFGAERARVPHPLALSRPKGTNTVRIFVFGESAAYGDPQPWYGLPRMLEAMLSLRQPGVRFEVVNAAMTGINSHGILEIARDCVRAQGDVWVVYMGNNEVVGPFGAGTVFGPQVPPLSLVRAGLALKSTRLGQAADQLLRDLPGLSRPAGEWGGLMMFLDQPVRSDDPRLTRVYRHFERNLHDLLALARRHGVDVVLSTVAVNLRDCAPFGSAHRPDLSESDRRAWTNFFQQGVAAQAAGQHGEALEWLGRAARLDDTFAELRYRQGLSALVQGAVVEAGLHFRAARDHDTLRVRCDSRLNELIREAVAGRKDSRVRLVDAEAALDRSGPAGGPGREFFYDHVHLTFEGNHTLARLIAPEIESLLRQRRNLPMVAEPHPWPSVTDCARRLGWSNWARQGVLAEMLIRLSDPPFTVQLNHEDQIRHLRSELEAAWADSHGPGLATAAAAVDTALGLAPEDPWLHLQRARLLRQKGNLEEASQAARRVVELVPSAAEAWSMLGLMLAQQQRYGEALAAFERVLHQDPRNPWAQQNRAQTLWRLGRTNEALRSFQKLVAQRPYLGPGWLGLGMLLESMGRTNEALPCFQKALEFRLRRAEDLALLARFCQTRGWWEAACTNYLDALRLNPLDAQLHLEAAQCLGRLNRRAEALQHYAEAVRLAPGLLQARFLYGLELARAGQPAAAETQFREAVRLMPDLLEARLNLALTLMDQERWAEATEELKQVLARDPAHAMARRWLDSIRARAAPLDPPGLNHDDHH